MDGRIRSHAVRATNPQRRLGLNLAAGRRVPTEGHDDGSGASFQSHFQTKPTIQAEFLAGAIYFGIRAVWSPEAGERREVRGMIRNGAGAGTIVVEHHAFSAR